MSGFIFARFVLWEVFPTLLVLFHFRTSFDFAAAFGFIFSIFVIIIACHSFMQLQGRAIYNCRIIIISSGTIPPRPKIPSSSINRTAPARGFAGSLVFVRW
jgi:LytS/YehU family sensor histidine kinase